VRRENEHIRRRGCKTKWYPERDARRTGVQDEDGRQLQKWIFADGAVDLDRWHRRERCLKPINSHQRQHARKNRADANQHHEQFEKICQTTVINEFFDGPKTNCTDDANNQNSD
jgi:hypothetical protein